MKNLKYGVLLFFLVFGLAQANTESILQIEQNSSQLAIDSQKKAVELDEVGQNFFEEFRTLRHETLQIEAYNQRLEKWNTGLKQEIVKLREDKKNLENSRRELLPLLEDMVARLRVLIINDLPFKLDIRLAQVKELEILLQKTNVSQAEKLRKIFQTYRQELDYGKTIEAYNRQLQIQGKTEMVKILRLGRIGLYYLASDGSAAFYNSETKAWQKLNSTAIAEVKKAIDMAENSGIPQLLYLPLSVAGDTNEKY